jgi:hypothetical protein
MFTPRIFAHFYQMIVRNVMAMANNIVKTLTSENVDVSQLAYLANIVTEAIFFLV